MRPFFVWAGKEEKMHKEYDELSGWQKHQVSSMFLSSIEEYRQWYYEVGLSGDVLSRRREKPADEVMRDLGAQPLPGLDELGIEMKER
jgi:hypothetical protein